MTGERRGAQLIRTLRVIRALEAGWVSLDELVLQFQVSGRTLRRDLAFLRGHGFVIPRRGLQHDGRGRGARPGDVAWRLTAWPEDYRYDLTQPRRQDPPLKTGVA